MVGTPRGIVHSRSIRRVPKVDSGDGMLFNSIRGAPWELHPRSVGELCTVCSQIVLKCLSVVRVGRLDILWSVNKFARAITKWTRTCDKRLARLISYIHHTSEFKQFCRVGNTAHQRTD